MTYWINSSVSMIRNKPWDVSPLSRKIDKATFIADLTFIAILCISASLLILQGNGTLNIGLLSGLGNVISTKAAYTALVVGGGFLVTELGILFVRKIISICAQRKMQAEQRNVQLEEEINRYTEDFMNPHLLSEESTNPLYYDSFSGEIDMDRLRERAQALANEHSDGEQLKEYLFSILDNQEFQDNPTLYLSHWKQRRGSSEEFRFPEDSALSFFENYINLTMNQNHDEQ